MLSFTVPGKVVSNNRVTRRFGNRSVKNPDAVTYQQRVFQHAFAAAQRARWKKPAASQVDVHAYNVRLDADNIAKCVLDGMNGAIYDDDNSVVILSIYKHKDHEGERVEVQVSEVEPLVRPKKPRATSACAPGGTPAGLRRRSGDAGMVRDTNSHGAAASKRRKRTGPS